MTVENMMPRVVNLWAGPGVGKSTTAAGLFNLMKGQRYKVELVTEVAKLFTYERNTMAVTRGTYVLALQAYRLHMLKGQVDWIITDCGLGIELAYTPPEEHNILLAVAAHERAGFINHDVYLTRSLVTPYQSYGRSERTLEDAIAADKRVLAAYSAVVPGIDQIWVEAHAQTVETIFQKVVAFQEESRG